MLNHASKKPYHRDNQLDSQSQILPIPAELPGLYSFWNMTELSVNRELLNTSTEQILVDGHFKVTWLKCYTRFPQATTKLRPPYLGILSGLRKAIFRQFLLTLYMAVGGLSGRSKYQISAKHLHDQEPKSYCPHPVTAGRRRLPQVAAGWICDPSAINQIKPRLSQGQPQVTVNQSN